MAATNYIQEAQEVKAYLEQSYSGMCQEMQNRCKELIEATDFEDESSCKHLVQEYWRELQYKIFG